MLSILKFSFLFSGLTTGLTDRLYFNAVPDFIDLNYKGYHWFIFNVADVFITIGIICLIFAEILNYKKLKWKQIYLELY